MTFPIEPRPEEVDERGLFVVHDPELRSRILPLFNFDPNQANDRPRGHGTTFRIDPWSRCATAYHVMEDLFDINDAGTAPMLRPDLRLAALELNGLAYGAMPLPQDAWRPLAGSYTISGIETPPFQAARLRNATELVVLRILPAAPTKEGTSYFPVDLRRWQPRLGESVLALGFADLDVSPGGENRPIAQYLYGSIGQIIDIEPAGGSRGRPWPVIRVDAEWPGGMSGGPMFNETGHVVGLVSSGIGGSRVGTATFFSGWDMPQRIFGSLDPDNPGWFLCHGVFDQAGQLVFAGQDKGSADRFAEEQGLTDQAEVAVEQRSGDYVRR